MKKTVEDIVKILAENEVSVEEMMQIISPGVVQILDNFSEQKWPLDLLLPIIVLSGRDTKVDLDWDYRVNDFVEQIIANAEAVKKSEQ